jgi:hypothetical protein
MFPSNPSVPRTGISHQQCRAWLFKANTKLKFLTSDFSATTDDRELNFLLVKRSLLSRIDEWKTG